MEWAKTCSEARFNLATSGLTNVRLTEFPLRVADLEITSSEGYGYQPLLERLARHTGAPEECIVTAAGTSMANHLAMAAVLNPGDEVVIEQPTYGLLVDVANYLGAIVKRFTRKFDDEFAVDPEKIVETVTEKTRLIVLSNLHNPSGALVATETLQAIAEIARGVGAHVLVDEVYLEMLSHEDAPFCFPIGQKFATGRDTPVIVTSSLTKAYGLSGLRCGWILASPPLAKRIWLLNDLFAASPTHVAERMSVMALDHLDVFRQRASTLLQVNRGLLDSFLDSRPDLECFRPPAGTVVFPRLACSDPERFFQLLREKYETTVVPGKFFEMPHHFRLGIGGETGEVSAGLDCLRLALDELI
jgi:aspartate/methionine/tyrosine aminotransferase